MKKIILVRYGEIVLKGLNRGLFEDKLIKNIKKNIHTIGKTVISKSQARIIIKPVCDDYDFDLAIDALIKIFGIISVSIAYEVESDLEIIKSSTLELIEKKKKEMPFKSFKIETKRGNKNFPLNSLETSAEVGGFIHEDCPHLNLKVDVHNPDVTVYIEVRESTYIYTDKIKAFGGMPIGTNGKAMLMLSGGIDSPVAGFMIGKRGVEIEAVHFYSYPYTSERAKEKVCELARILSSFCGGIKLHIVPFTKIQLEIKNGCPEDLLVIVMRRIMLKIAQTLAIKNNCMSLVTGESIGQVASQTMHSLCVTDMVADMPVFRPLIGMDKEEVIQLARKIDTFETSILPYEDCCTLFVAKHPKTKPKAEEVINIENKFENMNELINEAIENVEELSF